MIKITFPDGNVKEFAKGTTAYQIAESISPRLAADSLAASVNGATVDLNRAIEEDASIKFYKWDDPEGKHAFWHTSSHLLAEALEALYPGIKFGIGPAIENGFYYDVDSPVPITEADLETIEKKMIELSRNKEQLIRTEVSKADALKNFTEKGDPYKVELIRDLEDGTISFYTNGAFTDLCRGPHLPNTGLIKAIKLTSVAGAYWRGNAAVYLILFYSYIPAVILVATAILCAFSVYEIYRATGTIENEVMFTVSMLIAVLAAFVHIPRSEIVLTVAFIFATVASIWLMIRQKHCSLDSPVKAFFIVLLIIVLFKAIPELRSLNSGLYYLIFAVTLCFVTDVAAYLIGRGLGRHKLMPKVSPNKTIEGSLGGLLFGVLLALLGGIVVEKFVKIEVNYGTLALWALMTSVVGQFGDLSMSVIKRICGIKDYGNLLPGHGGILDRFDSHLFAVPFTYLFCTYAGGFFL